MWYRSLGHDEPVCLERTGRDARYRKRENIKRVVGDAFIVGAVVVSAWSMMPG
jgi:hypothetical protein